MDKLKFVFFVVFFFNIYFEFTYAYERIFNLSKYPNFIKINLDSKAAKKIIKNTTRAFFSTRDDTINFNKNSWTKANLEIDGKNYPGEIKMHGGQKDHLDPPFTSLKVKLKRNYNGIRQFILFLEGSRDFEKEIFWSSVIEELGFPSPVSFLSSVEILGEKRIYLFQEKIGKEFLENYGIGDFPIVEYDERQMWSNYQSKRKNNERINWANWTDGLMFFGKVDNERFIKNLNSLKIAQKAVNQINYNYQFSENIDVYDDLHGIYSKHALYGNNRKFVYNPMYNILTPIYYDGGNWSFDLNNINCKSENFLQKTKRVIKSYNKKFGSQLKKHLVCTANDIFLKYGDINWTKKRHTNLTKLQKENFIIKEGTDIILPDNCYGHLYHENSKCLIEDNLDTDLSSVFFQYDNEFFLCEFIKKKNQVINCKKKDDFDFIKKIISGNVDAEKILTKKFNLKKGYYESIDRRYIFNIGIDSSKKNQQNKFEIINFEKNNFQEIILNQSKTYILNLQNRDYKKNFFDITFRNQNSRLIVIGKVNKLDKFNFQGDLNTNLVNSAFRYDENKLTGCVTFLDVHFEGGNIFSDNMFCEDNVNIIRGKGKLDRIELTKSKFDALDLDFSEISIDNIKINHSGNDCVDISYGVYNFKNIELDKCGDKGLSVGERSKARILNLFTINTNISVAAKDSSKVYISKSNIDKTKICLAAYNKKSEFDGGEIYIDKFNCKNFFKTILKDESSTIVLENKKIKNTVIGNNYILDEIVIGKKLNYIEDLDATNNDGTFNAVIEISLGDKRKYEVSKVSGKLEHDFEFGSPIIIDYSPYPVNYGLIPNTVLPLNKGGDGDPLDILILGKKIKKGEIIKFLPIGIIRMTDEGQKDDKIIGINLEENKNYNINFNEFFNSNSEKFDEIRTWFENYKGFGVVQVMEYKDANDAIELIREANKFYKKIGIRKF